MWNELIFFLLVSRIDLDNNNFDCTLQFEKIKACDRHNIHQHYSLSQIVTYNKKNWFFLKCPNNYYILLRNAMLHFIEFSECVIESVHKALSYRTTGKWWRFKITYYHSIHYDIRVLYSFIHNESSYSVRFFHNMVWCSSFFALSDCCYYAMQSFMYYSDSDKSSIPFTLDELDKI